MRRRAFLSIGAAAAGASAFPVFSIGNPNQTELSQLRVGCIGMGKMQRGLLGGFMSRTTVVAVCDVDTTRRDAAQKRVNDHYGNTECASYVDYRELLARDDIDVVSIATPDHWHAAITIAAARTGKDIYCEKPLTHDIDESIRVMREVEKAGVILQTGSQQRSSSEFRTAAELVRNEIAGKLKRITCSFSGPGIPCDLEKEELEPGLDWNRWCGYAPRRPYNSILSPRGCHNHFPKWRRYKEYGGGGVCDFGAHHLDIAQWALGMDESGPVKALPTADLSDGEGARLVYANGIEVVRKGGFNVEFECENGRIQVSRKKFSFELEGKIVHRFTKREDGGSLARAVTLTEREFLADAPIRLTEFRGGHMDNFLHCVLTREKPIAHVSAGARTAICCHLLNLTYYKRQAIHWDPKALKFSDDSCDPAWLAGSRRDYLKA